LARSSYFNFDKQVFQELHYINESFPIGITFNLSSSYKCFGIECLTNLKLILRNNNKLLIDLWCESPAGLLSRKYDKTEELSCALNGINATAGIHRLSAIVKVHTAGSFILIFSVIFPNNPDANQEWSSEKILILNSTSDEQQTIERMKRQDNNIDGIVSIITYRFLYLIDFRYEYSTVSSSRW